VFEAKTGFVMQIFQTSGAKGRGLPVFGRDPHKAYPRQILRVLSCWFSRSVVAAKASRRKKRRHKKSQSGSILPIWGESPLNEILRNFACGYGSRT